MTCSSAKVLVIGYGNPGRLDDGLGPALAEAITQMNLPNVTVDSNYQLTVEDAEAIARHDVVIFADASVAGTEPFEFRCISPKPYGSFTTHSVTPEAVLGLAEELFAAHAKGYVLAIRGYEFNEFGERLSAHATDNLTAAVQFAESALSNGLLVNAGFTSSDVPPMNVATPNEVQQ